MFFKIVVHKNFAIFTGNICWSFFPISCRPFAGLQASNFNIKGLQHRRFSVNITPPMAASETYKNLSKTVKNDKTMFLKPTGD